MPDILNFKVIVEQDEKSYFVASVPSIPGCYSQGKTYEETLKNIKEAVELCLEVAKEDSAYRRKIAFPEESEQVKFIGVAEVSIPYRYA